MRPGLLVAPTAAAVTVAHAIPAAAAAPDVVKTATTESCSIGLRTALCTGPGSANAVPAAPGAYRRCICISWDRAENTTARHAAVEMTAAAPCVIEKVKKKRPGSPKPSPSQL